MEAWLPSLQSTVFPLLLPQDCPFAWGPVASPLPLVALFFYEILTVPIYTLFLISDH